MTNELFMSSKELAMALSIGLWAIWPGIWLGIIWKWALEALWRNPEAEGKIRSLSLLFIWLTEAVVIYALVISLIIWFAM